MVKVIKNIPKNQHEILNDLIEPYYEGGATKPDVYKKLRGNDISVRDDKVKDLTVNLEDIDVVILYYIKNIIKPFVIENGNRVDVPVIFALPEMWKTAQKDGRFKDKEGKMLLPVIALKRNSIDKVRDIGNRLDGNKANLYVMMEKKYSNKNIYDRFSAISNKIPVRELHAVAIPDYLKINYNCSISTNYMQDMNKIIESIMYTSDSYWGDKNRFKFKVKIDTIPSIIEHDNGTDRIIKCNFDLEVNGYILPDTINKDLSTYKKMYSKSQLVFNTEISDNINSFQENKTNKNTNFNLIDSTNSNNMGINPNILIYLNVNKPIKTTNVPSDSTAVFNATFLSAPSPLPSTGVNSFTYFINGQLIENDAILGFVDNGNGTCTLTLDTNELGFILESGDEILAIGKFQ